MNELGPDLAAAQAGCLAAFGRLYDRFGGLVLSVCRTGGAPDDAEDATQEVFLRARARLDAVTDPAGLGGWLIAIARRVCAERRRASRRRTHHETEAAMRHAAVETSTAPPADAVARAEDLDRLTAALARLPDNERLAIHLHYLGDPCFSDPASVLGVSRSGYYKVLERARRRLAHLMQEVSS